MTTTCRPQETSASIGQFETPRTDIWEVEDAYVLSIELPGLDESSADVTIEKQVLTVSGELAFTAPEGWQPSLGDCRPRRFARSFRLPDGVDSSQLDAAIKDGVLTVRLAKPRHAMPTRVAVRSA